MIQAKERRYKSNRFLVTNLKISWCYESKSGGCMSILAKNGATMVEGMVDI
jgi:hypothetical protein